MTNNIELFIIHSNIDNKSVIIDNHMLIIIIIFLLFLVMVNK
jgi:hypothetical protein